MFALVLLGWGLDALGGPAFSVISKRTSIHVRSDLSYVEEVTLVQRVLHSSMITDLGHQRVEFRPGFEEVEILEAFTQLGDGTKIPVPLERIMLEQEARSDSEVRFNDRKAKVVIFPKVAVGASLHLKTRKVRRTPVFPGVYSTWMWWSLRIPHAEVVVDFLHDAGVDIQAVVRDPTKTVKGGRIALQRGDPPGSTRYRFTYANVNSESFEAEAVSSSDFSPSLQFGNLKSWSDVAMAYRSRAQPVVTQAIAAKAREITLGARSLMHRVERLHHWVTRNLRYVSVSVQDGGYVPHAASSVLDSGYGDCKDQTVLLQALLQAVGVESTAVLVDTDPAFVLPLQPTPFAFDHVMVYVPALGLYLDPTAEYARAGTLPGRVMGKQVLHVNDGRLARTPSMKPGADFTETTVNLFMDAEGVINGDSESVMRGHPEVESRRYVAWGFENGESRFVGRLLARAQEFGTGEIRARPGDLDQHWVVRASFELEPPVNRPGPAAFRLPLGLAPGRIVALASREPDLDRKRPFVCESVRHQETINLELPEGQGVAAIPKSVSFKQGTLTYKAEYSLEGRRLKAVRTFVANRPRVTCDAKDEDDWKLFRAVLLRDLRSQIVIR